MKIKHLLSLLIILFFNTISKAQADVEMADAMRSEGKIYVVVAVMLIIFSGIIGYLIYLDNKISKLEKK